MKNLFLFCIVAVIMSACKDSTMAQYKALSKPHIITLYAADGNVIKSWESTGSVSNEAQSDGWFFEDKTTGKLVEVTGTIIIEVK